jgi:hypothetical protein
MVARDILVARRGLLTRVSLTDGTVLEVWDSVFGRDLGDEFDHVTTNCSPPQEGRPVDFFMTFEIFSILDAEGRVLFPLGVGRPTELS